MDKKVLTAEARSEKAVRRISASLALVVAAVLLIMILSAYLKFKPQIGEEITDGKLKQFLDKYSNVGLLQSAVITLIAGLLAFLPSYLADASTIFAAAASIMVLYQKSIGNITKFPNGVFITSCVFFAASVYCSVKRNQIFNAKGRRFNLNSTLIISSLVFLANAFVCKKIVAFKAEYELYSRLVDVTAEDFVEKNWGIFEPLISKIDKCVAADYTSIAIVSVFIALIILVLHNFPILASLAATTGTIYTLYKITVSSIAAAPLPIFFMTVFAATLAVASVSSNARLRLTEEYDENELDPDADEDDEDDAEYLETKAELEKNGLEMQDF